MRRPIGSSRHRSILLLLLPRRLRSVIFSLVGLLLIVTLLRRRPVEKADYHELRDNPQPHINPEVLHHRDVKHAGVRDTGIHDQEGQQNDLVKGHDLDRGHPPLKDDLQHNLEPPVKDDLVGHQGNHLESEVGKLQNLEKEGLMKAGDNLDSEYHNVKHVDVDLEADDRNKEDGVNEGGKDDGKDNLGHIPIPVDIVKKRLPYGNNSQHDDKAGNSREHNLDGEGNRAEETKAEGDEDKKGGGNEGGKDDGKDNIGHIPIPVDIVKKRLPYGNHSHHDDKAGNSREHNLDGEGNRAEETNAEGDEDKKGGGNEGGKDDGKDNIGHIPIPVDIVKKRLPYGNNTHQDDKADGEENRAEGTDAEGDENKKGEEEVGDEQNNGDKKHAGHLPIPVDILRDRLRGNHSRSKHGSTAAENNDNPQHEKIESESSDNPQHGKIESENSDNPQHEKIESEKNEKSQSAEISEDEEHVTQDNDDDDGGDGGDDDRPKEGQVGHMPIPVNILRKQLRGNHTKNDTKQPLDTTRLGKSEIEEATDNNNNNGSVSEENREDSQNIGHMPIPVDILKKGFHGSSTGHNSKKEVVTTKTGQVEVQGKVLDEERVEADGNNAGNQQILLPGESIKKKLYKTYGKLNDTMDSLSGNHNKSKQNITLSNVNIDESVQTSKQKRETVKEKHRNSN